jgi:membrane protein required for colicin V production
MFSLFDIIIILAVFWFALFGLWFGFVHTVGSLIGVAVAAFVSGRLYELAPDGIAQFAVFIGIFLVVHRVVGLLFYFLSKSLKLITLIPLFRTFDRIGGLLFGFIEGVLIVGTVLLVASRFELGAWITSGIAASPVAPILIGIAGIVLPLLPDTLKKVQESLPFGEG